MVIQKTQKVNLTNSADGRTKTITLNSDKILQPKKNRNKFGAFEERLILSLTEIYVAPSGKSDNIIRDGTMLDERHIDRLVESLLEYGILYDEYPPVIERCNISINGRVYFYKLTNAGLHRYETFKRLGITHWIFDVYSFDLKINPWAGTDFGFKDNDHPPSLETRKIALSNSIGKMMVEGRWGELKNEKLEETLHQYLQDIASVTHKGTRTSIITDVLEANPEFTDVVRYSSKTASEWVEEHTTFAEEGEYDPIRKMCGWVVGAGYLHERVWKAIKKYSHEKRESYFGCHTVVPRGTDTITTLRNEFDEELTKVEKSLDALFAFKQKHGRYPWQILYFLPQDRKAKEDMSLPIMKEDVPFVKPTQALDLLFKKQKKAA